MVEIASTSPVRFCCFAPDVVFKTLCEEIKGFYPDGVQGRTSLSNPAREQRGAHCHWLHPASFIAIVEGRLQAEPQRSAHLSCFLEVYCIFRLTLVCSVVVFIQCISRMTLLKGVLLQHLH